MTSIKNECVYFFKQKGGNHVKIGMTRSDDVSTRFQAFCTYSPFGGQILGVIKTENSRSLESSIHKELSHRRLKGEFFNVTEEECQGIIQRYNSDEVNDIVSNFYIWLANNEASAFSLNEAFKKAYTQKINDVNKKSYVDLILKYMDPDSRTGYMTATEIKNLIEEREQIKIDSMTIFGSNLREVFGKSKMKRIGGIALYRYYVGLRL